MTPPQAVEPRGPELCEGATSGKETILLRALGVSKRYGTRTALAPTDLSVNAGELILLVGPNGAGKSTLLSVLAFALAPSTGQVRATLPPSAIGWVPQRPAQYRRLSPRENLMLFARLLRLPDPAAVTQRMLLEFGLPDDQLPSSHLSVGYQQRLNLAIGFLGDPRVLLLDEPAASLDQRQARALWERLGRARQEGAGAVVATHLAEEAEHADRIVVLEEGRIVFAGGPSEYRRSGARA